MLSFEHGDTLSGAFAQNSIGCLTIQFNGTRVVISYTPNDETSVADVDAQMLIVPERLFVPALERAGYSKAKRNGK